MCAPMTEVIVHRPPSTRLGVPEKIGHAGNGPRVPPGDVAVGGFGGGGVGDPRGRCTIVVIRVTDGCLRDRGQT